LSVDFLTDCHAAPAYSYLHLSSLPPFPINTLDCAPIVRPDPRTIAEARAHHYNPHLNITSTAYRFKTGPARFVDEYYTTTVGSNNAKAPLPIYIVVYNDWRFTHLEPFLRRNAYHLVTPRVLFFLFCWSILTYRADRCVIDR
jgi:hypothetical protein